MTPESSAPPVIAPISTGARSRTPRNSVARLTAPRLGLGERVIGQPEALQTGGHGLEVHRFGQAHVDVLGRLRAFRPRRHGVRRHRLPTLGQWHGVRRSVDRDRGHRRSGRCCSRGVGLVRYRRGRISLDSSTSTDTATPVDRSGGYTASSGITFTQSSAPPTAPPPARPRPSAWTPAACPPSAMTPPSPVTRPSAPSPTCSCPSRRWTPSRLMSAPSASEPAVEHPSRL